MTTQQPEALDLANWLDAVCNGGISSTAAAAELRRQHTRIAELEAQIEAIGAGGVSGPLMDRAPLAASAGSEPVAWRELCRRLYVELFYCNQQMTSGIRPKWQHGKTVRDALADAKAALDAAPQTSPASQGDALPREEFAWLVVREACETEPADEDDPECIRILRRDLKSSVLAAFLRHDAARAAQEVK